MDGEVTRDHPVRATEMEREASFLGVANIRQLGLGGKSIAKCQFSRHAPGRLAEDFPPSPTCTHNSPAGLSDCPVFLSTDDKYAYLRRSR